MQLVIDIEKDSVAELKKAIEILQQVVENKVKGVYFAQGLERFNVNNPRSHPEKVTSPQGQKMLEQEKMMADMDLSKVLERKHKRRF